MRQILFILAVCVTCLLCAARIGCHSIEDPQVSSSLDGGPGIANTRKLPVQQWKGLRAEAIFRTLPAWADTKSDTHVLDLRLVNTESIAKANLSIESVKLGNYPAAFRRPPIMTLWMRADAADFPAVARWSIPQAPRSFQPLDVIVRYERRRAGVAWDRRTPDTDGPYGLETWTAAPPSAEELSILESTGAACRGT